MVFYLYRSIRKPINVLEGKVSKETMVLRRRESMAGNLVLTTELKT